MSEAEETTICFRYVNPAEVMAMVMLQIGLCSKSLLDTFHYTDAAVPDAVVAVPAIVQLTRIECN